MPISSKFLGAALMAAGVMGDVYMHFPPGSNDRNRERNENRNNGNRLFDTQNNAKGGYAWCGDRELTATWDGWQFYTGSTIQFEWTNQHASGPNGNTDAQLILQYACDGMENSGNWANQDSDYLQFLTVGVSGVAKKGQSLAAGGKNGPRDGYPSGPKADSDTNQPGQYYQATFKSTGQNADGTNRIPCPSSIGCEGNFGNTYLDTLDGALSWYNAPDDVSGSNGGTNGGYIAVEFGYHESFEFYYKRCMQVTRNKGLYTADQQINGNDARFTRQNPNGNRDGFECVEERDYYPWWGVSPWRDIAILVSHADNWVNQCAYYKAQSQNNNQKCYCKPKDGKYAALTADLPISQTACTNNVAYSWVCLDSFGIPAPDCVLGPISKDNHLGNTVAVSTDGKSTKYSVVADLPQPSHYNWMIPDNLKGMWCVLRLRYNMSSADYPQSNWNDNGFKEDLAYRSKTFFDSRYNCPTNTNDNAKAGVTANGVPAYCQNYIDDKTGYLPVFERAYLKVATDTGYPLLAMAFQTDQVARTFEDRSYVIHFMDNANVKPTSGKIVNLNNRGRRGNIVQCYPAVENDFYPVNVAMTSADALHIQFCGSDFNPQNNPNNGEGWQYSTRWNIVKLFNNNRLWNYPDLLKDGQFVFDNKAMAYRVAFADQKDTLTLYNGSTVPCVDYQGDNSDTANNKIDNCAKLNSAKAHIDFGVMTFPSDKASKNSYPKTYNYVSTRNNNFSNRGNKGSLIVYWSERQLTTAEIVGISIGSFLVFVGIGCAAVIFYAKRHPNSKVAIALKNRGVKGFTAGGSTQV